MRYVLALTLVVLIAGCGGGSDSTTAPAPVKPKTTFASSATVTKCRTFTLAQGATVRHCVAVPSSACTVRWARVRRPDRVIFRPTITCPSKGTTLRASPPASGSGTGATFYFAANEPATFACKLDAGAYGACTSPTVYTALALGAHTFYVRATDLAGNVDATPATYNWTIVSGGSSCATVVSTVAAIQPAMNAATAGSAVCLANGSYGNIGTLDSSKAITVRAQNPGGATISDANLTGQQITLQYLRVINGSVVIRPTDVGMSLLDNYFSGGYFGVDAGPTSTTYINDTTIRGNKFEGPFGEDAIRVNRYHDSNGDGYGLLVEENEFTKVIENGNHSDALQSVWGGDHLVYRRNYLHDNRCQGFFIKDQLETADVITVRDNLFLRNAEPAPGQGQPIYLHLFGPMSNLTLDRNTVWGAEGVVGIRENGPWSNIAVTNNVFLRKYSDSTTAFSSGYSSSNNRFDASQYSANWPDTGFTNNPNPSFNNPATDDYRIIGASYGVDWRPADYQYGP